MPGRPMRESIRRVRDLVRAPVVVAPMGGGPSTPALVAAASDAGALAFLAAGYKTVEVVAAEIAAVRRTTDEAFGVNVFVPGRPAADPDAVIGYLASLAGDADALGVPLGTATWDDDGWSDKLQLLVTDPVPVVTFTFGFPPPEVVSELRSAGSLVGVTVTGAGEATRAAAAGADLLCVQGIEAGAHRGSFSDDRAEGSGWSVGSALPALLAEVAAAVDLPLIAAGGLMSAEDVGGVLSAGAVAAQCGTAFLRCPESGAHPVHKAAIADGRFTRTDLTRAFSGRLARGLGNRFLREHTDAPSAYPEINNATRPLRAAAAAAGDVERMSLWAGTGFRQATDRPAGEIVAALTPTRG